MSDNQTSQDRLLAGKYRDQEALEKGYLEQSRETQRIIAERRALEERVRLLNATVNQLQAANQPSFDESDPEAGLSAADMRTFVADELQKLMTPLFQNAEAVGYFGEDQAKINTFLRDNPDLQQTFQRLTTADPQGAAELVTRRYRDHVAEVERTASEAETAASRRERHETRPAAEVAPGRGVSRSEPDNANQHAERLESLATRAREGDWNAKHQYTKERLFGGNGSIEIWAPGEPPPPSMLKGT